jgi:hypothetical protein
VNWDQIAGTWKAGTWKEVSGKARARWGEITDDGWAQPAVFPALMWAVRGNVRTRCGYARVLNRHSGRRRAHRTIGFAAKGSLILFLLGFSGGPRHYTARRCKLRAKVERPVHQQKDIPPTPSFPAEA